jgi:anthranilate phosphoribosyltransferase
MAEQTLAEIGIAFLFAQTHHPCLKHIAPIRRALGRRTIFNLMGPLANPANVRASWWASRPAYVPIYAEAIRRLGTDRSFVISGDEGLDELSLAGGNEWPMWPDTVAMQRVDAADAGLPSIPSRRSAAAIRRIMPRRWRRCCRANTAPIAMRCCSTRRAR